MADKRSLVVRIKQEGGAAVAHQGLGEMPLTLWVIVAGVILYLYVRRANLGIDTHPAERVTVQPPAGPPVRPQRPGTPGPRITIPWPTVPPSDQSGLRIVPIPGAGSGGSVPK